MASHDYYKGGENFPPPSPSVATFGSAPPPYQEHVHPPPEQARPSHLAQHHDREIYQAPPPNSVPWLNAPNKQYPPSEHYYQPHSQQPYAPPVRSPLRIPGQSPWRQGYSDTPQSQPSNQQYPPQNNGYHPQNTPYPPQFSYPPPNNNYRPPRAHSQQPRPHSHSPRPPHHRHRRHSERRDSKSNETKLSFLGAGAGGLIGDLLLGPGVGTLGGAIIGALSGKNAAKKHDRD